MSNLGTNILMTLVILAHVILIASCSKQSDNAPQYHSDRTLGLSYRCSKDADLNSFPLSLNIIIQRNQDTKDELFDFGGTRLKHYEIKAATAVYQTVTGQRPNLSETVAVSSRQSEVTFLIEENGSYPPCYITFHHGSNFAKQVCDFEGHILNARENSFELRCARIGKMRVYKSDEF